MRNTLFIAVIALIGFSCGDAGVGFNIGKEFPITIPVDINDIPQPPVGSFNPPSFDESISYTLDKVDAFQGVDFGEVVVRGFAYEITGVDANENVEVETIQLTFVANGEAFASIDIDARFSGTTFENIPKTALSQADFDGDALSQLLLNGGEIRGDVTFDFGELPPETFNFDFTLYFDVLLKARDI